MATITLYAYPCEFERSPTASSMKYEPFGNRLVMEKRELAKATDVQAALVELSDKLVAEDPSRSFFAAALCSAGRKPNGFDRLGRFEYDASADAPRVVVAPR